MTLRAELWIEMPVTRGPGLLQGVLDLGSRITPQRPWQEQALWEGVIQNDPEVRPEAKPRPSGLTCEGITGLKWHVGGYDLAL